LVYALSYEGVHFPSFEEGPMETKKYFYVLAVCVFLSVSCQMDNIENENTKFIPVGEWSYGTGENVGGYNITTTTVEYYAPEIYYPADPAYPEWGDYTSPAENLKGNIISAIDFSHNAGVLIIQTTETDGMFLTVGKYTCVYYKDYTSSYVLLANPYISGYIEVDTISEAKNTFTVDNVGTHVAFWGSGYTK
jgi:hypothetical protein